MLAARNAILTRMEGVTPMQASDNLAQKSYRFQNSVRVVSGYGASIRVDRGHLVIADRGMAGTGESRLNRVWSASGMGCAVS